MTAQASYPASDRWALAPVHPGEVLRNTVLPAIAKTPWEVADLLGVPSAEFSAVLDGGRVTADMALRLGKLCGNGPDLWLNMQSAYDLKAARGAIGPALDAIPTLHDHAT